MANKKIQIIIIYEIFTFFCVRFFIFLYEENNKPCKNNKDITTKILSLLHHFISLYIFLGSFIFGYHFIHLLFFIIVFLQWKFFEFTTGKSYCIITHYYNKLCGHNTDDIHYILPNIYGIYKLIYLLILYDIYHIIKK